MLKNAIPPQLRFELLVGDGWLLPPLRNRREIVEVLQQLFIVREREHDGRLLPGLVGEVLQGFAHASKITRRYGVVESGIVFARSSRSRTYSALPGSKKSA